MTNEELVQLYQQGDKQALETIIEQNKGIVYTLVNKFYINRINSVDKEDLEQEGIIGLIIAANKYKLDIEKPCKFSTYAVYWIYNKINRYVNKRNTNNETSLNMLINESDDTTIEDTIRDNIDLEYNCIEKLYQEEMRRDLEYSMNKVNTLKEREILILKYGLNNYEKLTYKEIGEIFNTNGERIRQISAKAMRKLRNNAYGLPIKKYRDEFMKERASIKYDNVDSLINWYVS
ncbi:RNA polymerase sigma factor SigA [Clostridium tepidiprofundi DSM 19306]|uniref:RNA polymerase sigma factor SigA n=1 Tax=Clostridium tepidiprofundi DSM 19306 TaxID=1121338 RepID=A0A151ASX1_9CLOT|nr:sigma-70 family RNA polymerase sigma factor [Clostridium tepidiprofundi]KYH30748.1 RNA polymerase sigma factor SigA [Clostridium tepidiprofundi DSM 19306]